MGRPIGVTVIAVGLLGFSLLTASRTFSHPGGHKNHTLLLASVLLTVLAFFAAEALWSLRSNAFLLFSVWGLCAMVTVALQRLGSHGGAHVVRVVPSLVYTGLIFAGAALYLRRAV